MRSDGKGKPRQLTDIEAFYTDLAFSPDGSTIVAMRGNEFLRNQTFSEFGGLRIPLELISLPAKGGEQTVIKALDGGRYPHFGPEADRVYLTGNDGLFSLTLSGTDHRDEMTVNAPRGNRRGDDPPRAEAIYIHPDGNSVLAFANKQVWWIAKPKVGAQAVVANLRGGDVPVKRLTHVGADYLGWSSDGSGVWWAIGNTFHSRPLASLSFEADDADSDEAVAEGDDDASDRFVAEDEHPAVTAVDMDVVVPRSTPTGALLLERVNLISMSGRSTEAMAELRTSQDILIVDNRIHAIGNHGSLAVPEGAARRDLSNKFVVPGFIDTHAHWEFRTSDVLEPHNWSLVANVAYGVTAGLDVQTASNDYLAYRDFVETGQSIGQRAFMTARGVFGDTDFQLSLIHI